MGIAESFTYSLYEGGRLSSDVPAKYMIALNGRGYVLDLASGLFRRESVPLLRNQADTAGTTGENSINPQELWRRPTDSWHKGAGQRFFDKPDSDPAAFRDSKGVDVWTKNLLSLLPEATSGKSIGVRTGYLATTSQRLYLAAGDELSYSPSPEAPMPVWTAVSGTPLAAATSIASDGFTVYTTHGASGLYSTNAGTATSASFNAVACTLVRYVKGRVMVANGGVLSNVIASGAAPAALFTHPNGDFRWVDMAEGPAHIFAAGFSGDKSLIYRIAVVPDGTTLDAPIMAGELPDGEVVRSITGYLGFLLIGSDLGVRLASIDGNGNLTIGGLIRTPAPVRCFEAQDRFVWYGLANFDATSSGLGRVDLSTFTQPLLPAYASDLMVDRQGSVDSVVTFKGRRFFTVTATDTFGTGIGGVIVERDELVESGYLDGGGITYGIPDEKVAVFFDVRHEPLKGEIAMSIATSVAGTLFNVGGSREQGTTAPATPAPVGQRASDVFEVRIGLTRSAAVLTDGPRVTRYNLRSYPRVTRSAVYQVPILLRETHDLDEQVVTFDVGEELRILTGLVDDAALITYQEGSNSHTVLAEDFAWVPYKVTTDGAAWSGTLTLRLKQIAG